MSYEFNRNRKDQNFIATKANASGGANSDAFDLEQVTGGDIEQIAAEIALDAEAGLSDTKNLYFALEDSADGTTFAAVDPLVRTSQVGAGGSGAAAKTVRFRFPPNVRRYVRIAQTADATPGTLAGNFVFSLLF